MAKREDTSETTIGMIVLVMNLEKIMRDFLFAFFIWHTLARKFKETTHKTKEKRREKSQMAA